MDVALIFLLTFLWSAILLVSAGLLKFLKSSPLMTERRKNVLYVISHPDDECMFFAPSILKLTSKHSVHLLCLSTGDYYSSGVVREKELLSSCSLLSIHRTRIRIVNDKLLPDHPGVPWRVDDVMRVVQERVTEWNIDIVITFDEYGVSGHSNHRDTYQGVSKLIQLHHPIIDGYKLTSHNLLRKYSSIFDVIISLLSSASHVYLSNLFQFNLAQRAMLRHRSQMEWFRYLYISCSRYMIINDLERMS